jgi:F-type H+-transporting ATPase subunit delta
MTARAAATRYARALFDVAAAEGTIEAAQVDLQRFTDLISGSDALAKVIANPAIPVARKKALVTALLERLSLKTAPVAKLIRLLADRDRLSLVPEVARAYRARVMEHQRVVRGEVTTAAPLPADALRRIEASLARATGRTVTLDARVDPSIIGGAIAKIGSTVYDGSITTQVHKVKEALIEHQ